MTLKYLTELVGGIARMLDHRHGLFYAGILFVAKMPPNLISHWIYASQYLKTCVLVPSLIDKAKLVLERHNTQIKSSLEQIGSVPEFIRIHDQIDKEISD